MVTNDDMDLIHGSGNIYRDFNVPNPEMRQLKALLAAQVHKVLDDRGLTTRQAQAETGIDHSDFSRVRRSNLSRFSIERLVAMLEGLGQQVEVSVKVQPRRHRPTGSPAQPSL